MKTMWVFASAAVTALGILTSPAKAQEFMPGMRRPPFGPNPQAPRPGLQPFVPPRVHAPNVGMGRKNEDDRNDRQHFGSTFPLHHFLPHIASGATPGPGRPETTYVKPAPSAVPAQAFPPHTYPFKVPSSLPEYSSHISVPRGGSGWFRLGSGRGIFTGVAGGIAAAIGGALFGRKKNTPS